MSERDVTDPDVSLTPAEIAALTDEQVDARFKRAVSAIGAVVHAAAPRPYVLRCLAPAEQDDRDRDLIALIRDLRSLALGIIEHDYAGACPAGHDRDSRNTDRDNTCPACAVLIRADALLERTG